MFALRVISRNQMPKLHVNRQVFSRIFSVVFNVFNIYYIFDSRRVDFITYRLNSQYVRSSNLDFLTHSSSLEPSWHVMKNGLRNEKDGR